MLRLIIKTKGHVALLKISVLQKSVWLGLEILCELRGPFSQYHLSEGRR